VLTPFALICVVGGSKVTGQANSTSAGNAAQSDAAAQGQAADNRWATTPVTTIFPATLTAAVSGIAWDRVAIGDAQNQSEGVGGTQTSVDFVLHALAAPGTAAANFGDPDLLAMTAGTWPKGAPADWLALVVEAGSVDGPRAAGDLPSPWAAESGGNQRDRDSWYVPAQDLTTAFGTYYQKLFG
jgi:hypothetical protein